MAEKMIIQILVVGIIKKRNGLNMMTEMLNKLIQEI